MQKMQIKNYEEEFLWTNLYFGARLLARFNSISNYGQQDFDFPELIKGG